MAVWSSSGHSILPAHTRPELVQDGIEDFDQFTDVVLEAVNQLINLSIALYGLVSHHKLGSLMS